MKNAVIFGGSGFIGIFFAKYLIEKEHFNKIFILDLEAPINKNNTYRSQIFTENQNRITYVKCDVRDQINWIPKEKIDLIANFAAIHREPGHNHYEYYDTNIKGAENVCNWLVI